jgi:hypothetical protein
MGGAHSARHNTTPRIALPTSNGFFSPLHNSSGFLCIDTLEIYVHVLNPELESWHHCKYRTWLHSVLHQIYTSYHNFYPGWTLVCQSMLPHGVLRLVYCQAVIRSLWS